LLTKSADQDYLTAQVTLALCLVEEKTSRKFPGEGLGRLACGGYMTQFPQDNRRAAEWFARAADHGHAYSAQALGLRYASGVGVPHDDAQAYSWLTIGLEEPPPSTDLNRGHRLLAEKELSAAQARLTAAQRGEVDARLAQWQAKPAPIFGTEPVTPT